MACNKYPVAIEYKTSFIVSIYLVSIGLISLINYDLASKKLK